MKPLLRAVLIVDAGLYLSSGAALLLSPLAGVQRVLQLTPIGPAMVGQMLGLALLGLAWLSLRGAFDGAMTIGVAKIVGHVTWLAGVLVVVWAAGPHALWLPPLGIVPNLLIGAFLILIGLGGARLAGAVRRREVGKAAQTAGDGTKDKAKAKRNGRIAAAVPAPAPAAAEPVEPVLRPDVAAGAPAGTERQVERPFASRPEAGFRAPDAAGSVRSGAASGDDDVRAVAPSSAPRPPFHG